MRRGLLGRGTQDKAQSGGAALAATGRGVRGEALPKRVGGRRILLCRGWRELAAPQSSRNTKPRVTPV